MNESRSHARNSLEALVENIRQLHAPFRQLIPRFREAIAKTDTANDATENRLSGEYWSLVAYGDSLVRLRLLLEQNFNYFETLGVLALTRYVFEVTVWLRLIQKDRRYGLVYYGELLKTQRKYWRNLRDQMDLEVTFLQEVGERESELLGKRVSKAQAIPDAQARNQVFSRLGNDVMQEIDDAAARRFSLYSEQAKVNGYGFQAHLVKTKRLPKVEKAIAEIDDKLEAFDHGVSEEVKSLATKQSRWQSRARLAGRQHEYEFIYRYTSRLLHATPASLTTDQKNLEIEEILMFLKYVRIRLLDVLEMAKRMLATGRWQD